MPAPTNAIEQLPKAPTSAADLGVPYALVEDLVLRRCMLEGRTSVTGLANALCISAGLIDKIVQDLREKKEIEVLGMVGRDYDLTLSGLGQQHAADRQAQSRYAGACPVSLSKYREVVACQRLAAQVNRESLKAAFSDLVVADELLDDLGPSLNANGAMFLYGPPGTGKTSIAERLVRVSPDLVLVPRAVEVDGQIISVFDSTVHLPADSQPEDLDPRWVLCNRPRVVVGGELVGSMLDLTYDGTSGVYLAPLQMKANNGVMIIDDFGRQVMTPDQLLNRWIVPLDRRIDFLSLDYGVSFEVPFDVKVVLSTNLDPADLGDEAFFRRIQTKIFIGSITEEAFDWILARVAHAMGVGCDGESAAYLRRLCIQQGGDLRPYLPGDVCKLIKALALYEGIEPVLDPRAIDRVLSLYYTRGIGSAGGHGKTGSDNDDVDELTAELDSVAASLDRSSLDSASLDTPSSAAPGTVSTF